MSGTADSGGARRAAPGLRFECTECGECCTSRAEFAHVYVDAAAVRRLARHLKLAVADLRERYTFEDADGWTQLRFRAGNCVFLDPGTRRCRVYQARPSQCRTFPFWPGLVRGGRFTAEARRLCEGVGQGRRFSPAEVAERLAAARREEP